EAPGTLVEVVGTLFAIEVRGAETCTSVAHGQVRVTGAGGQVLVAGGERYCTGGAVHPIASEMRDALEHHQAAITARATPPERPGDPRRPNDASGPAAPSTVGAPRPAAPPNGGAVPSTVGAPRPAAPPNGGAVPSTVGAPRPA